MPGPEDQYIQDIHYLTPAGFNAIESKPDRMKPIQTEQNRPYRTSVSAFCYGFCFKLYFKWIN